MKVKLISILNYFIFQSASKASKTIETKQNYVNIHVHFYNFATQQMDTYGQSLLFHVTCKTSLKSNSATIAN
jgi:hypothetical protein